MKKIIKTALNIIIAVLFSASAAITGLLVVSDIKNRPKTETYITGRLYGNIIEQINSRFTYCTYDTEGNLIRKGEMNIYSGGKFNIEFSESEKYFIIYRSSISQSDGEFITETYIDKAIGFHDMIPVEENTGRFFRYDLDTDRLSRKKED